jgi:hypothetical protein
MSDLDCVASDSRVSDDLEEIWKERPRSDRILSPRLPVGTGKITLNLRQDSLCPSRGLNRSPPEHKPGALLLEPTFL